jgi:spore coat polysaccharide biosynthesis protein SpsF (cytidylyltransferase family)
MKIVIVTQARTGSTRLPNKILKTINNETLLEIHLKRLEKSKLTSEIIVATTDKKEDDLIELVAKKMNLHFFRGSEHDVLDRFYQATKNSKPDYVVRVTSDCPLIDPILIDAIIEQAILQDLDYYTNVLKEQYPDGQDIEVFKFTALERAWEDAVLTSDREHVTPYIRNNSTYNGGEMFQSNNHDIYTNYNHVRLTVDELKDFEVIKKIIENLGTDKDWKTYANYYLEKEEIQSINNSIIRNEGYIKSLKKD